MNKDLPIGSTFIHNGGAYKVCVSENKDAPCEGCHFRHKSCLDVDAVCICPMRVFKRIGPAIPNKDLGPLKNKFYRIAHKHTHASIWYGKYGKPNNLIHTKFGFCKSSKLPMKYDEDVVGYLSAVNDVADIFRWFPKEDLLKLQEHGYLLHEYTSDDCKQYNEHWLINKKTANLVNMYTFVDKDSNYILI